MRFFLTKWRLLATAAVLAAAFGVGAGGCGDDDDAAQGAGDSASGRETQLLLSFPESIAWVSLLVARDQGYFADEGLDVSVQETEGSSFVTQQIISGNFDFGWAAGEADVVAYAEEPDLRALMCDDGKNIFRIVAPEDSDIHSVEDLRGGTLGFTEKGGGEEPLVDAAVRAAGIEGDVELVPIGSGGPQSRVAIESGRVDAYGAAFVDIAVLEAAGLSFRDITPERFLTAPGDCLIALKSTLEDPDKQKTAVGITRAWKRGMIFTQEDPDAALDIACEAVPEECENMEFARALLQEQIDLFQPADPSLEPGQLDVDGWQTTADVLAEAGTIESEVDVTPLVDSPEVQAVVDEWIEVEQADGGQGAP